MRRRRASAKVGAVSLPAMVVTTKPRQVFPEASALLTRSSRRLREMRPLLDQPLQRAQFPPSLCAGPPRSRVSGPASNSWLSTTTSVRSNSATVVRMRAAPDFAEPCPRAVSWHRAAAAICNASSAALCPSGNENEAVVAGGWSRSSSSCGLQKPTVLVPGVRLRRSRPKPHRCRAPRAAAPNPPRHAGEHRLVRAVARIRPDTTAAHAPSR